MNLEEKNCKEEILEIVEKCNSCGLCKENCPVFKVLKQESFGSRGQIVLMQNKIFEDIIFTSPLSKAPQLRCPQNIDIVRAIKKARQLLVVKDKENENMKKFIKKITNKENPFYQ